MPTVTATTYPDEDYVLVETDWTDLPAVTHVAAYRVRQDTGERVALYPYIAYNESGCLMLNCGEALWWDTDPPLGVPLVYEVTNCTDGGEEFVVCSDTFTRTPVVADWGTSTSGCPWTTAVGAAAQFSTTGAVGNISMNAVNSPFQQVLSESLTNVTAYGEVSVSALALTQPIQSALMTRWSDSSNYYHYIVQFLPSGSIGAVIQSVVAGVATTLASVASVPGLTYVAGSRFNVKAVASGTSLSMTVWAVGTAEPVASVTATNAALPGPGRVGVRSILAAGNTNALPVVGTYDNIRYYDPFAFAATTTVESAEVELDPGKLWLKNPLSPCLDLLLTSCGSANVFPCEDPEVRQIVFSQMGPESFAPNTVNLLPVNRRRAIPVFRERRDIESVLTLVSRTFADRDALRETNRPGTPLLFQAPAEYGIDDRYMSVGEVTEARGLPDHRFQPRVITLPHVVVDRPEGTANGVCGARFADQCDTYTSLDAMTLAGVTYKDLLLGLASPAGPGQPPVATLNTWQEVLDGYADWGGVNNGQDWEDVLEN